MKTYTLATFLIICAAAFTKAAPSSVLSVFGRTGNVRAVAGDYNTSLIPELGANQYFSPDRARASISAIFPIIYDSPTGSISCPTCLSDGAVSSVFGRAGDVIAQPGDYTTAQITESGTVLYFTQDRARSSLSASAPIVYNPSTGMISCPTCGGTAGVVSWNSRTGAVVPAFGDYNTSMVSEATNLYFTNARSRSAISVASPIVYDPLTGIVSCPKCVTLDTSGNLLVPGSVTAQQLQTTSTGPGTISLGLPNGFACFSNGVLISKSTPCQ